METSRNDLMIRRRTLFVDGSDLSNEIIEIRKNIKGVCQYIDIGVKPCNWAKENKFRIRFFATNRDWKTIRKSINVIRVWDCNDIPHCEIVGKAYSID